MLGFWLFLILLIALIVALPWWPYSRKDWGYWPGGIVLALLIFWLVFIWFGWVAFVWPWGVAY